MLVARTQRLTLNGAKALATAATARAAQAGIPITVAVADAGGHLLVLERMDGGRFHTVQSAVTKAVCAASNRRITGPVGAMGQPLDAIHALGLAMAARPGDWTAMEGGCPVIIDGDCVGAVGVSGASFEVDALIARETVEAIGATWEEKPR
jgi:uncharacterized protein GlcG (DUF336 family)